LLRTQEQGDLEPVVEPAPVAGKAVRLALPPWGWRECAVGFVLAVFALLVLSTIVSAINGPTKPENLSVTKLFVGLIATILLEATLFGIAYFLTVHRYGGGLRALGWRPRRPPRWLNWSALTIVLAWTVLLLYALLTRVPGLHRLQPHGNIPKGIFDHPATVPVAIFLTVVAAPVVEETFFRGFLFNGLRRLFGVAGAAAVSGALFAMVHAQPQLIIPFTGIGMLFAYAYYRTGTLWTSVSAHMLFNLVSVVAALHRG
jgi:membrane protease YdiL (CAAX protease family)